MQSGTVVVVAGAVIVSRPAGEVEVLTVEVGCTVRQTVTTDDVIIFRTVL